MRADRRTVQRDGRGPQPCKWPAIDMTRNEIALVMAFNAMVLGCATEPIAETDDGQEIVSNLIAAGFPASDIMTIDGVVYVGRDAAVTLQASRELRGRVVSHESPQRRATERQYRTNNLLDSSMTTVCVNGAAFGGTFSTALDNAIANYNDDAALRFTMLRTSGDPAGCSATITAVIAAGVTGGSSGFPAAGRPYATINIGDGLTSYPVSTITHVITHELGHAIGLRHSDYYNRSISCGAGGDEGDAGVGAILIAGTPSGATVGGSVMNSCFRTVEAGRFTGDDLTGLLALYAPSVPPRVGVRGGGHFYVKEGGLSTNWVDELAGADAGLLSGNRMGALAFGHLYVKEGGLGATWSDQFTGATAAALSGNRIGVLSGGHWYVKEGALDAVWSDQFAGAEAGLLSGNRIGVLSGGHLYVKEGSLNAVWSDQFTGATAAALSGNRIGVLSGGHWYVKEGGLDAAWTDQFSGAQAGWLSGNRIGVLAGGHLYVKEGGLSSTWVDEFSGATAASLSGNRIGVLSSGHWYVKEGRLDATWIDVFAGAAAGVLPNN